MRRVTPRYRLGISWAENMQVAEWQESTTPSAGRRDLHADADIRRVAAPGDLEIRDHVPGTAVVDAVDAGAVDGVARRILSVVQLRSRERILWRSGEVHGHERRE